jgi:protein-disulfide isomerase/peroxiredoxin/uncharacterized membrane protein
VTTTTESSSGWHRHDGLPWGTRALYLLGLLVLAGIGIAVYMLHHKLALSFDPTYVSACNLGSSVNCDAVNTSRWSELFGLPIALYAIPTYATVLYLLSYAIRAVGERSQIPRPDGARALALVTGIGALAVAHSAYLLYVSVAEIRSICLFCTGLYLINLSTLVVAAWMGPRGPWRTFQAVSEAITTMHPPALSAIGMVVIVGGASWVAWDTAYEKAEQDAIARVAAELAGLPGAGPAPVMVPAPHAVAEARPGPRADAGPVPSVAPATAPRQPVAPAPGPPAKPGEPPKLMSPELAVRQGPKNENGWAYFETPVAPNEFWYGNPAALVTVVKFADFQCAYCKFLASNLDPVMKQYKDQVRFVMKNFPMNGKCNPPMASYDKHPYACEAAAAGYCAGVQGKFWEMHDKLYEKQAEIEPGKLAEYASDVGLEVSKFQSCLADPATDTYLKNDIAIGYYAGLNGTPRTYVNGRMLTGSTQASVVEYHIQHALRDAQSGVAPAAAPATEAALTPPPDGSAMLEVKKAGGTFFIDPYEAAVTADGRAVSLPGVEPAQASWFEAKAACEKVHKRLCSEEEWVSACTGQPAVDNNQNGWFSDDDIEGNMFPYGAFYAAGACQDEADKYRGRAVKTGSLEKCRTPGGLFDLAGNLGEWISLDQAKATLMGGDASAGEGAACNRRSYGAGAGLKNHTTGFRCCADAQVRQGPVDPGSLTQNLEIGVGSAAPALDSKDQAEQPWSLEALKGKVVLVNFFASWCGPCKKEFPFLVKHQTEYTKRGFQILAVGVDTEPKLSVEFAKGFEANFPILPDPESILKGKFGVHSMPATFIVDRQGVIRYADIGFKPEEQAEKLKKAIEELL